MNIPLKYRPKYIEGYEGEYGVCRAGFVYSFKSWIFRKGGTDKDGYKKIGLYKNGEKLNWFQVHRLVALTFLENPNNLPEVNHINEIKDDNRVCNLEWCDRTYNANYGTIKKRIGKSSKGRKTFLGKHHTEETKRKLSEAHKGKHLSEEQKRKLSESRKGKNNPKAKPILMFTKDGEFIRRFDCIRDALRYLGKSGGSNISACAKGKKPTAYDYIWTYEMED